MTWRMPACTCSSTTTARNRSTSAAAPTSRSGRSPKPIASVVGYTGETEWDTTKPDGTPQKLLDVSKLARSRLDLEDQPCTKESSAPSPGTENTLARCAGRGSRRSDRSPGCAAYRPTLMSACCAVLDHTAFSETASRHRGKTRVAVPGNAAPLVEACSPVGRQFTKFASARSTIYIRVSCSSPGTRSVAWRSGPEDLTRKGLDPFDVGSVGLRRMHVRVV